MKRVTVVIFLLFLGCKPNNYPNPNEMGLTSLPSSIETKSTSELNVSAEEATFFASIFKPSKNIIKTCPFEKEGEVVFHIINYDDGWVIISGDKRTDIVLASSDNGHMLINETQNESLNAWIDLTASELLHFKVNKMDPSFINPDSINQWLMIDDIIGLNEVGKTKSGDEDEYVWVRWDLSSSYFSDVTEKTHLIQTKWGQGYPWNYNYPTEMDSLNNVRTCPVGCTAVAMAQVINYMHHKENTPTGLHHGATVSGVSSVSNSYHGVYSPGVFTNPSPRWSSFAKTSGVNAMADSVLFVREFLSEVGHSVGMKYHWNGSGAWPSVSAINSYGLNVIDSYYSTPENSMNDYFSLVSELNHDLPIILVEMYHRPNASDSGHTWLIDGYSYYTSYLQATFLWEYRPNDGIDGPGYRVFTQQEAEAYFDDPSDLFDGVTTVMSIPGTRYNCCFYMNWGWDGLQDSALWSYSPMAWCNSSYTPYSVHFYHELETL